LCADKIGYGLLGQPAGPKGSNQSDSLIIQSRAAVTNTACPGLWLEMQTVSLRRRHTTFRYGIGNIVGLSTSEEMIWTDA